MEQFHAMFPTVSVDTIESVLRSNHGLVENTIDDLLLLASPYASQAKLQTCSQQSSVLKKDSSVTLGPLPNDFLRLAVSDNVTSIESNSFSVEKLQNAMVDNLKRRQVARKVRQLSQLDHEQLAVVLQNQELLQQSTGADYGLVIMESTPDRDTTKSLEMTPTSSARKPSVSKQISMSLRKTLTLMGNLNRVEWQERQYEEGHDVPVESNTPFGRFRSTLILNRPLHIGPVKNDELHGDDRLPEKTKGCIQRRILHAAEKCFTLRKGLDTNRQERGTAKLLSNSDDEAVEEDALSNGYNQPSDADYNIGTGRDLKQGRLMGRIKPR